MSQDITFMTPGSVWVRDNGKKSILLFVTNLNLKDKFKAKNPPQAVYLNEEGDVLTQEVDNFMATRTFFNVEPAVETLVDKLLAFRDVGEADAADEAEDLGLDILEDGVELVEDEAEEVVAEVAAVQAPIVRAAPDVLISFADEAPDATKDSAAALSDAVVAYSQQPILSAGLTDHIIEFDRAKLEASGITTHGLESLFNPDNADCIPSFYVTGDTRISWTAYIGIFPKMSKKVSIVCLHLGTDSPETVEQQIAAQFAMDAEDSQSEEGPDAAVPHASAAVPATRVEPELQVDAIVVG